MYPLLKGEYYFIICNNHIYLPVHLKKMGFGLLAPLVIVYYG